MTERLAQLLHEEAGRLPVPPAPTHHILDRAHRGRRHRRHGLAGLAMAASLAVVGGTVALTTGISQEGSPGALASYTTGGAWSEGSTVHFGRHGEYSVDIDAKIKSMYYTSAGVVVRSGTSSFTDDEGPSHYALVTPDGNLQPLGIDLGDRAPDTDPDQPYLAYAEPAEDGWKVVVRDVTTDDVVAKHPLPDAFTWGGWNAPPVALVGDHVYVAVDDVTAVVDWRTGAVSRPGHLPAATYPDLAGDVYAETLEGNSPSEASTTLVFRRLSDGSVVAREHFGQFAMPLLSPGGSVAMVQVGWPVYDEDGEGDELVDAPDYDVYDMTSGQRLPMTIPDDAQVGWTPDDHVLVVGDDSMSVCDPATGACEESPLPEGTHGGAIKLAGTTYES